MWKRGSVLVLVVALFLLGFLACAGLLAYALYTQFYGGLLPCPLCIFQRVAFAALGLVFLLGALHGPSGMGVRRVYGVMAGLEVLRSLNDLGYETLRPVEVVVWTNEEGCRYAPAMMGSGVWVGKFDEADIHQRARLA